MSSDKDEDKKQRIPPAPEVPNKLQKAVAKRAPVKVAPFLLSLVKASRTITASRRKKNQAPNHGLLEEFFVRRMIDSFRSSGRRNAIEQFFLNTFTSLFQRLPTVDGDCFTSESVYPRVVEGFDSIREAAATGDYYSMSCAAAIQLIASAFHVFPKESEDATEERRKKIAQAMVDFGVLEHLSIIQSGIIKQLLPTRFRENKKLLRRQYAVALSVGIVLQNYAHDILLAFSLAVSKNTTIIETMLMVIQQLRDEHLRKRTDDKMESLLGASLALAYNLSMQNEPEICEALVASNVTGNVRPFLQSGNELFQTITLLYIIYVGDEKESIELTKNSKCMEYLLKLIRSVVKKQDSFGFSASELMAAIEKFAVVDENKEYLRTIGIMDVMKDFLSKGNAEEQKLAIKLIIMLSFDTENARVIKTKLVDKLRKLSHAKPDKKTGDVSEDAKGALEVLSMTSGGGTLPNDPPPPYSPQPKTRQEHIMISYSWSDSEKVLKIKDLLEEEEFKVWIDRENITTDKYGSISSAVESAWLVLVFLSRKYEKSPDCRMEYSYAKERGKKIIPVKVENFKPDGWMGLMIAGSIYHRITNDYSLEGAEKLLIEVKRMYTDHVKGKQEGLTLVDGAVQPQAPVASSESQSPVADNPSNPLTRKAVKAFDQNKTRKLLEDSSIHWPEDKPINGEHLICLADMRKSDPDSYRTNLKEEFGITSVTTITALKKLLQLLKK